MKPLAVSVLTIATASWAVPAKEAKTWPFIEAWGGKDMMEKTELLGQDATSLQLDETRQEEQETNALESVSSLFGSLRLSTLGVHALFPLMLAFTLYLGLVLWASSTLHRADHHLYKTISELNAKTDQITEGLAALAQIYIDNYHFSYRSNHEGQEPFLNPSHIPSS
ncbi:uncharacterized protein LOC127001537 isoform X2 [Eriocheir sinensis]|uniref:uncharacterized protein LOC127001537 isoform X2 n=1 Tax=Eriocheir sinensis TaxID=95602 RepID=UPI0021CABE2B|nr:uncharacterized protein LOC127001537 isoform X2 [Eriocheir sinensis]